MEWVETTGRTVEQALESALDQLGIDERDAEVEVVEEPKSGLFGRLRSEARIRARVRPTRPRPKLERHDRGRKRRGRSAPDAKEGSSPPETPAESQAGSARSGSPRRRPRRERPREETPQRQDGAMMDDKDVPLDEQAEAGRAFLDGLVRQLALAASVDVEELDEETVELRIQGGDLGFLIGPKGATLSALQDITRTVVNRRTGGRNGRILVDVAEYRQKRKSALQRFTRDLAAQVKQSGQPRVLEPMSPPDRKVVHDTVNEMDGVSTTSEGEEPARRVVINPE